MSQEKISLGGRSGGQVEGLAGAERHAPCVGLLELLLAEMGAHLLDAVAAVARIGVIPRRPGRAEEGLGDAVEQGRPAPVARVGSQARQAEAGVGHAGTVPDAAADPQGCLEAGSRAVRVAVLAQHPAHVDRQAEAFEPDCLHSLCRLVQVSPGGGDVPGAQGVKAGVVVEVVGIQMVAGSLYAGHGLGEQRPGASGVDEGIAQQVQRQTLAEQDIIAELAGALDGFPSGGESSLRLAGQVVNVAEGGERCDEQAVDVELAGELDRLFAEP